VINGKSPRLSVPVTRFEVNILLGRYVLIVFYSWQSELPTNKKIISDCLEEAVRQLNQPLTLDAAERDESEDDNVEVELDHDTKGVLGIPEIVSTIFTKIDQADVFIADVSYTGVGKNNSKLFPNSNVLIELGYALGKLGGDKVILVMDSSQGSRKKLPFDLVHRRWPITFSSQAKDIETEKTQLVSQLVGILQEHKKQHKSKLQGDLVDLSIDITYKKEQFNSVSKQRGCNLTISGMNKGTTALKNYELLVKLPRQIVLQNSQTGKVLEDSSDEQTMTYQFPISQDNPLPVLFSGKAQQITQILLIVHDHNVGNRSSILEQEIEVTLFGDGIPRHVRSISMKSLDPFRLMDLTYDSRDFKKLYKLEPIPINP
jgi:hypothetical protein